MIIFKFKLNINYFVDNTICPNIHKSLLDNFFYNNCILFKNSVEKSLYLWSKINKLLQFETDDLNQTNLVFSNDNLDYYKLGLCFNNLKYPNDIIFSKIIINLQNCLHQNTKTCSLINNYYSFLELNNDNIWITLLIWLILSLIIILIFIIEKYLLLSKKFILIKSYLILYFTFLVIYFKNIQSCFKCYSMEIVLMHEIGHAFGLDHSTTIYNSIMSSTYNPKLLTCLYQKDIEMFNQIYNTTFQNDKCIEPIDLDIFFIKDFLLFPLIFIISYYVMKYLLYYIFYLHDKKKRVKIHNSFKLKKKDTV